MKIAARRTSIAMAMQSAISLVPDDYNPAQASTVGPRSNMPHLKFALDICR
jgi:hypothetical protein